MPPRVHTHPSLPQVLLDEINGETNVGHKRRHKGGQQLSRKEARRQARETRKQRKAEHFSAAHAHLSQHGKRRAEADHAESPQRKKVRLEERTQVRLPSGKAVRPTSQEPTVTSGRKAAKQKTTLQKLAEVSGAARAGVRASQVSLNAIFRTPQEEEEDAYIAYLERKLGWVKGGKRTAAYGRGEEEDGLDDLLKDLDTFGEPMPLHIGDESEADRSGAEDDASETGGEEDEEDKEDEEADAEEDKGERYIDDEMSDEDIEEGNEEEWHGFGSEPEVESQHKDGDNHHPSITTQESPSGTQMLSSGSKYVPPHLRKHVDDGGGQMSEAQLKLNRQLKGLLNRMSEQNIASIVDSVEEAYRNNRRHDVTETITKLIIDGISSHSMLLDQYVVLHAAFVSALHKLIGIEFAAHFVQRVITMYDTHFAVLNDTNKSDDPTASHAESAGPDESMGKECSNLVVLLSELYNFQVTSCVLMYDVIRALLDGDLTEFKVELLLKVARNSGQQLRQDDPTALKSIIQIVHTKLPQDASALSSRTRFMVETLSNLKNNKIKKAAGQTAGSEAVERLKKFLSGLSKKRHVMSHEPLRVSLDDLRSAETKGKWWLVGAAWGGDPLVERQQETKHQTSIPAPDAPSENVLLKLAKKQGMNTDVRRSIFVVLMSADDYVDACDRLSQLKLTEIQQREMIRVILHCCGNEKQYNPYYALVGQQLCRLSHFHKITLQFCLWDFLRDMGETTVGGAEILKNLSEDDRAGFNLSSISPSRMRNVARAFGWWIAKDCCTLAILKPVDFTVLKPQTHAFMKELFTHALANTQLSTPLLASGRAEDLPKTRNKGPLEEVFVKGAKVQTLALGLVYFLREAFRKEDGFLKWASQVALDTLRTGMDVVPAI